MAKSTPATLALARLGLAFDLVTYDYDPDAARIGLQAAQALGVSAGIVFKTLMVLADGKPACVMLASDREVSLKALAAALGAKGAQMMPPADAERLTGYRIGGISPFGQKRQVPKVLDAAALDAPLIYLNGGQRGLQVRLAPGDAIRASGAVVAPVAA